MELRHLITEISRQNSVNQPTNELPGGFGKSPPTHAPCPCPATGSHKPSRAQQRFPAKSTAYSFRWLYCKESSSPPGLYLLSHSNTDKIDLETWCFGFAQHIRKRRLYGVWKHRSWCWASWAKSWQVPSSLVPQFTHLEKENNNPLD
jgi:hypothetical protein